jgi:hypothetical protein
MPFVINFPTYLKIAHRRFVLGEALQPPQMHPKASRGARSGIHPDGDS